MNVPIHRRFDAGMTQQLLQHLRLHPAFDCTRCIGVAQSVHTEPPDSCLIAQFVKVGIIRTVLCRFSCRFCKPHAVHWVLGNQLVHLRSLEHCTHCDIGLTDGGTRIVSIHLYEHLFAVHRLDVGNHHFAHNRLNIVDIPLPIIAERIGG